MATMVMAVRAFLTLHFSLGLQFLLLDPDSTRTPLILWGAGVRGPLPDSSPSSHDEYSRPWGLTHLLRRDVEQGDVAALMSTLLGIEWPSNSVGVLPDIDHTRPGFLDATEEQKAQVDAAVQSVEKAVEEIREGERRAQTELKELRDEVESVKDMLPKVRCVSGFSLPCSREYSEF